MCGCNLELQGSMHTIISIKECQLHSYYLSNPDGVWQQELIGFSCLWDSNCQYFTPAKYNEGLLVFVFEKKGVYTLEDIYNLQSLLFQDPKDFQGSGIYIFFI